MSESYTSGPLRQVDDIGFSNAFNDGFLSDWTPRTMEPAHIPSEFDTGDKRQRHVEAWQQGFLYALKIKGVRRGYSAI